MITARQLMFGAVLASAAISSAGTATAQIYLICDSTASPVCKPGLHMVCYKFSKCPAGSKVAQTCSHWGCVPFAKAPPPKCKPACKVGYICVSSSGGGESEAHCRKKSSPEQ
jgi:hypothetical protein